MFRLPLAVAGLERFGRARGEARSTSQAAVITAMLMGRLCLERRVPQGILDGAYMKRWMAAKPTRPSIAGRTGSIGLRSAILWC